MGISKIFSLLTTVGMMAMFSSTLTNAEDKLTKGELEYIGWQKTKTDFKTCRGDLIMVGNGVVAPTPDKCKIKGFFAASLPVDFDLEGKVEAIDLTSQIITVKVRHGEAKGVFVSTGAVINSWVDRDGNRANLTLENIAVGSSVKARVTDVGGDIVTNNVSIGGKR